MNDMIKKTYGASSAQQCAIRFAFLLSTLTLSLLCGLTDSKSSFYIAVMVQSLTNIYDAAGFLKGYFKTIKMINLIIFASNIFTLIGSILYFITKKDIFNEHWVIYIICAILSIPVLVTAIQMFILSFKEED